MAEMARDPMKPVRVVVSDPDSGEVFENVIVANDYVLITAGRRYLKSVQTMGKTHMLAVALAKPGAEPSR